MSERAVMTVQSGIWIGSRQLSEAGLSESVEVIIQPGEITIRAGDLDEPAGAEASPDVERAYPLIDESFRDNWQAPRHVGL